MGSGPVLGGLGIAVVAGVAFVAHEGRVRDPMLDLGLFRNPRLSRGTGAVTLGALSLTGLAFELTRYLHVQGYTPLQAGVRFLRLAAGFGIAEPLSQRVVSRIGTVKTVSSALAGAAVLLAALFAWARERRSGSSHGKAEFLDFMNKVARAYPRRELHVICDNYHTYKHEETNRWLARHSRITLHFTPTSGSWLNLAEVFFSIITRQAIRRGTFTSVRELVEAIRRFIDGWNDRCRPFTWTKTAEEILPHARRKKRLQTPGTSAVLATDVNPRYDSPAARPRATILSAILRLASSIMRPPIVTAPVPSRCARSRAAKISVASSKASRVGEKA